MFIAYICQLCRGAWTGESITSFIWLPYRNCVHFRYKFDDERVTKEDMKRALEEQYGGEEEVLFFEQLFFRILCVQLFCF